MKRIALIVGAVLALATFADAWLGALSAPAVHLVTIAPRKFQASAFGTGTVEARVSVEVGSKITGRVVRLLRGQGHRVRQGNLLAVLENDEFRQQQEQSALGRDKALESVHLEQANLARARHARRQAGRDWQGDKARRQLGLFTVILLVISTVIVALIIYTLTVDKIREIATLKLIGVPGWLMVKLIMQQSLALG
jgi:multidrug efflux pump subunit AcrA (membrane-fusion protein)